MEPRMTSVREISVQAQAPLDIQRPNMRVHGNSASLLDVISRAASDPNTDVDKLQKLLDMYERVTATEAKRAYMEALANVQTELPVIPERGAIKNREGSVQSRYALWEDVNDAIKPVLSRHGLALSFRTGFEADKIIVIGVLTHKDGHSEQTTISLPSDTSGSKNAVQAVGSSTSYGKRYTAAALLNITSREEKDDDAQSAISNGCITDAQIETLQDLIERSSADIEKFTAFLGVTALAEIKTKDYRRAVEALNTKLRKTK